MSMSSTNVTSDKVKLKQLDPVSRQAEVDLADAGLSPMDPPEAYEPPGLERVPLEALHPFLKGFCEEHAVLTEWTTHVEHTIESVGQEGFTRQTHETILEFCLMLDREFIPHSRREEMTLFPLLHERLIAAGEHSSGPVPTTPIDLMRDDHVKMIQMTAVITNFLKIATHLPEESSALLVRDAALRHTKSLLQLLKLHMFGEDNILFISANRLITWEEFDRFPVE